MPDFVGAELEFMSLLTRKEAYASTRRWAHRRRVTIHAEQTFLRDHLGRWQRALCRDISKHIAEEGPEHPAGRVYASVAHICEQFIEDELRRFSVKPLRLTQRMLGNREAFTCPLAAPATEEEHPFPEDVMSASANE